MDNTPATHPHRLRTPLLAIALMAALVAAPTPAKADRALAVFEGAVLLTSLIHAVSYPPPPRVVYYQPAAPVAYYPQQVVYQTAPVVYYPQRVVYQTAVPRY